jgi:glycosylphosphatidylinositol transamidase (GPIT) subunit GPI8
MVSNLEEDITKINTRKKSPELNISLEKLDQPSTDHESDIQFDISTIERNYVFISRIGQGSRGTVDLYEQQSTKLKLAVKSVFCINTNDYDRAMSEFKLLRTCNKVT